MWGCAIVRGDWRKLHNEELMIVLLTIRYLGDYIWENREVGHVGKIYSK